MNLYICNLLLKIHAGMNGLEAESYRKGSGGGGEMGFKKNKKWQTINYDKYGIK